MYEKVNPMHPDKIADRIAGALVDMAYRKEENPRIAVEVLIGHGTCHIIAETSVDLDYEEIEKAVTRIANCWLHVDYQAVRQDSRLADNQEGKIRCGDNGIFKGVPVTEEQKQLTSIAKEIYKQFPTDGKYILADNRLVICQSFAQKEQLKKMFPDAIINPLGYWTGGIDVDTGATNRKLGSDMGDSITGGGLHGKDLSKADVSLNICAFLTANKLGQPVEYHCSIGDEQVDGNSYEVLVDFAKDYIRMIGGFEKFAEWGLIR